MYLSSYNELYCHCTNCNCNCNWLHTCTLCNQNCNHNQGNIVLVDQWKPSYATGNMCWLHACCTWHLKCQFVSATVRTFVAQPILFKLSESTCLLLYYYIIQLGNGYNCRLTDRNFEKLMNIKCNAHLLKF